MSKSRTDASPDCGCSTGDCQPKPSRRQFFSRGAQSIAAIGVAVQSGAAAPAARPRPDGWLPTGLGQTRDMTVADGLVYVAGDSAVAVFKPGGVLVRKIQFAETPRCIVVAKRRLIVGLRDRVLLCDLDGNTQAETKRLAKDAALTSLAVAGDGSIYAADGGSSSIWRISPSGELLDRLAGGKGGRFAVPKSFFPITWANDSLVVAHPGRHRVERYDADGELKSRWGKRSRGLDGFSGCCNPVSVAVTGGGEFVTAERGQPRIKLFGKDGQFRTVIAGPEAFDVTEHEQVDTGAELATCQNGGIEVALLGDRVVALDHTTASFRLFDLA
ncbi:MAG: hypothetical protein QF497_06770 [Verrucomicrobiota bacterium]|jgi:hypothetical protein|nr:hypothetical protein [Verrucomicrobiota bacterium]MDP7291913.1 hypothetical protein [Verrucomicrobiota bacterium]